MFETLCVEHGWQAPGHMPAFALTRNVCYWCCLHNVLNGVRPVERLDTCFGKSTTWTSFAQRDLKLKAQRAR